MSRPLNAEKYKDLLPLRKTFTLEEAAFLLHGFSVLDRFRDAGQLKPCVAEYKMVLFKRSDVETCQIAIALGEIPNRLPTPKSSKQAASETI